MQHLSQREMKHHFNRIVLHCVVFIHFCSGSHSMISLSEALPTTAIETVSEFTRRSVQLYMKDLPKVPTWWLERDSNPRPSGRKASTLPMRYQAPQLTLGPTTLLHMCYLRLSSCL